MSFISVGAKTKFPFKTFKSWVSDKRKNSRNYENFFDAQYFLDRIIVTE